ncbi:MULTISPECIES: pirin family protein [Anoxybacillus]|uniref:pirin family protein n=1 Tax=Anoxybacillus TaxID=150247 RepID=UPI0003864460|nr:MULTISPECIES: pirin family protein [Anoxybacillus]EPZ38577.1 Pirin-like protein [Anoxybacillus ayderensis]NNU96735.1 pirin family protein [Anoxybacillus sp. EFIL]
MIHVYPAHERFESNHGWLQSYFSFSFAEYFDRKNMHFGPLRVFNDDIIAPQRGFGAHPHQEMEIVTVVLKGKLEHRDNLGNHRIISFGEVQRMTAGTGIVHSEMNPSTTEEVNLLQLWFLPETYGLAPSYEQISYDVENMKNRLLPIVSKKQAGEQVAYIHQDLTMYLSDLENNQQLTFHQQEGRRMYVFVIEGELVLNDDTILQRRDAARITDVTQLHITANIDSRFMLIDLP